MRLHVYDVAAAKRLGNLAMNSVLVRRAHDEGLNLSALAEAAVAVALARRTRETFDAQIAQACRAHEEYPAEYGSLGDAVQVHLNDAE